MSRAAFAGVVSLSHWTFMAAVLRRRLLAFIESGKIDGSKIPKGVYQQACEFFDLATGANKASPALNPPASANAYSVALDVMGATFPSSFTTARQLEAELKTYGKFVKNLKKSRKLSAKDAETAEMLSKFFLTLVYEGEAARQAG